MPPRSTLPRNPSSLNSRRTTQPKSSRQQFSACGACRMRRVRCDLKDFPLSSEPHQCSNCKERGLNCVDEYADMKSVKLHRRGRRLQKVEAIYGKVDSSTFPARTLSQIPTLNPSFFSSPFWTLFCIQRPIFDPNDFYQRYIAHSEGTRPLGREGGILPMLLVLWAATFGVDEFGSSIKDDCSDSERSTNHDLSINDTSEQARKRCREKTSSMLREILELVDFHGIMRRPTFDTVRILLLILPLLEAEAPHLERTAIYEAALSQARTLCAHVTESPQSPFSAEENHLRARVYLYAQIQEGISTALKGGRLVFHSDDLDVLRRTADTLVESLDTSTVSTGFVQGIANGDRPINGQTPILDVRLAQLSAMPFRLSSICRKIHDVLTGPKAARLVKEHHLIDANGMREIWDELDQCWRGFAASKDNVTTEPGAVNTEYFVDAWLIFIFECHNIVLESLKHSTFTAESSDSLRHTLFPHSASHPSSNSSSSSPSLPPHQLYLEARAQCIRLLPHVSRIIRHHLSKDSRDNLNLFTWDTGLVRDGCFFAGLLSASLHGDLHCLDGHDVKLEESDDCITPEEGVNLCLAALAEMRWMFSKSDERIEAIRLALKNSKERQKGQPESPKSLCQTPSIALRPVGSRADHNQYSTSPEKPHGLEVVTNASDCHPLLHLNIMLPAPRRVGSTPDMDGTANGWATYTPPTSSPCNKGSPYTSEIASPGSFKNSHDDPIFYHIPEALDHFTDSRPQANIIGQTLYHSQNTFFNTHDRNVTVEPQIDCLSPSLLTSTDTSLHSSDVDCYLECLYS